MTSGSDNAFGAAVAQPEQAWSRLDKASALLFAVATLGLAWWTRSEVLVPSGGQLGAPLDDSYIHLQFARSFARLHPLQYVPGLPPVPGATSLLWPALLTPAMWLGASTSSIFGFTWLLGFGALFGQACEVYFASRRFLSFAGALAAGLLVLTFSANTWFAASGMEVVPLGWLLLRSARRAAEFWESAHSVRRERELFVMATAAVLLRPEGALAALCVAIALLGAGRRYWPRAALAMLLPLLVPLINLALTGHAAQTTTRAKWLPANPYYAGHLASAVLGNIQLFYGTLLDGRQWSWTFIPEGYCWIGWACLPALYAASVLRGARRLGLLLCLVGFGILVPATYETFLVNRLRYLWPFGGPWLLGLAALGELLARPLARLQPRLALLGVVLPVLAGYGFCKLAPISVADVAQSAAAITLQQVSLGHWAAEHLPADATIGVNDAGAISYFSGRKTFDIVGLTTEGEAKYWVAGAGSRFEHYEHLPRSSLPSHFFVYPDWFGIPQLLGRRLTQRRVDGATILGGPLMIACVADWSSLGSGARPLFDPGARPLLDELDVADLESEAAHAYELGVTSSAEDLVGERDGKVDGGRARRTFDQLRLRVAPGGLLVVRYSTDTEAELSAVRGAFALGSASLAPGDFEETALAIPENAPAEPAHATSSLHVQISRPITVFHYWSYGAL
jgi:hypothetical protein